MLHAMIMAGGGGTRFWPRSRVARPKQFLTFSGDRTLLQSTLDRIEAQIPAERTWVITAAVHRDEARRQLTDLVPEQVVGEPMGRDTAACIGLGAALIAPTDPDAVMVAMPADHAIEPVREFGRALQAAEQLALDLPRALITFGIQPTFPAVAYGYIQRGETLPSKLGIPNYRAKQFREKPTADVAEGYIASGEYYWNSGIFVWKVGAILTELQRLKPKIHDAVQRIAEAWNTPKRDEVFRNEYEQVEKISIDKAVMEHAREVVIVQAPYQWDDVGSWLALERRNPQDADGNTVQAKHVGIKTANCVIAADAGHLIATIGVENLLIIQSGDATLIADRAEEATVKDIVSLLQQNPELKKYL
jgi:mannose-1-phosphate guanylyltransferase